jgi:hypothetical protein
VSVLELSGDEVSGWKPGKTSALQESPAVQINAAFSPDGRFVAYTSAETGAQEVYVRPFPGDGARIRISVSGGQHPTWSKKRSELFYRTTAAGNLMVASYRTEGDTLHVGKPQRWSATAIQTRGPFGNFDLHPDGDRFAVLTAATKEPDPDHVTLVLDFAEELRRVLPVR